MKQRILYIDIVKGIAICAVVMMHIVFHFPKNNLIDVRSLLGYFWHVPVFFVIAGFFIKENGLEKPYEFIKSKMKVLYLPALYIYIIATLLHNFLFHIGWYSQDVLYVNKMIDIWTTVGQWVKNIILAILCGGREPILGAMWFVYALFFALIGFCIISYICKKIAKSEKQYEGIRLIVFTLLQMLSCILTNKFGLTIPRCSNAISAMLLIYLGQQINQRLSLKFDNGFIALACGIFVYQGTILMGNGSISFNENAYNDMMQLTIGSIAALYMLCYVGKKIEKNIIGRLLAHLGAESFYIMCLHIIGFHLCTEFLILLGILNNGRSAGMTPYLNNISHLLIYFLFGITIPIIIMYIFRTALSTFKK